ncbi:MAG: prepilin peptidase [Anaerolineales bacterium]|jgi:leader peptidase (prepilin peptidase)/N-methyltransferase
MSEIVLIIILGWGAGMLVNYLADVLPVRRKLVAPFCLQCQVSQNTVRYFLWPRRCENCGQRRAFRTWIVEAAYIVTAFWLWNQPPQKLGFWLGFFILIYFGVVVVIDLEHRLILHPTSAFGALLGLGTGIWLHGLSTTLLGGLAGFGGMLGLYIFGILFVKLVSRGRGSAGGESEALGFGDVILSGVLGLFLGWPAIVMGLTFAIVLGGMVSLIYLLGMLIARRYRSFAAIPYGPFLIAGAVFLLYFRDFLLALT